MHSLNQRHTHTPKFSICIPQYNRTDYLAFAIQNFASQTETRVELCIVDDVSTDGGQSAVLAALASSGLDYSFQCDGIKRQYDAGLRAAIDLARGEYVLSFGNDDCFADTHSLQRWHDLLAAHDWPEVSICNFFEQGQAVRRMTATGLQTGSVELAIREFRQFGFVSGLAFKRTPIQAASTELVDGSKMYQMFLGCRLLAQGGRMLGIDETLILKDITLAGTPSEQFYNTFKIKAWPIRTNILNPAKLARVVSLAVAPACQDANQLRRANVFVLSRLYLQTYPYWWLSYRKTQSFAFAAGVVLGFAPKHTAAHIELSALQRLRIRLLYLISAAAAMLVPIWLFEHLKPALHRWVKRR